jgi:hypothetical protein
MASRSLDDALQARLIGSRSPSGEAMPVEPTIEDGYIAVVKGLMPTEARHA